MMKKFIITCPKKSFNSIENKLKILRKFGLNNIHLEKKSSENIEMIVDEVQSEFDSRPKVVKHLI